MIIFNCSGNYSLPYNASYNCSNVTPTSTTGASVTTIWSNVTNCTYWNETSQSCNTTTDISPMQPTSGNCPVIVLNYNEKLGLTVAYCIVLILALLGNSLIAIVVLSNENMKRSTNYFIMNMAMSDLIVPIIAIPREIVEMFHGERRWFITGDAGLAFCKVAGFLQDVGTAVSIFSLLLITCDRFFAVVFPLKHHILSSKACKILILMTWLMGAGIYGIYLYLLILLKNPMRDDYYVCWMMWSLIHQADWVQIERAYYISNFTCMCIVPFTIMVVAYTIILFQVRNQSLHLGDSMTDRQRRQRTERENKILRMAIAIVFSFALCWSPFNVSAFLQFFIENSHQVCWLNSLNFYAFFPTTLSTALNPLICFYFSENFRQGLKTCLRKVCSCMACLSEDARSVTSTRASKTQVTIYKRENRAYDDSN